MDLQPGLSGPEQLLLSLLPPQSHCWKLVYNRLLVVAPSGSVFFSISNGVM